MNAETPASDRSMPAEYVDAIAARVVELLIPAIAELLRAVPTAPKQGINPDAVYTTAAAAKLVGLHPQTLNTKLRNGVIEARRRRGGRWMIHGRELLKLAGPTTPDYKQSLRFRG